jgi:acetyltransferase-like isoleucine patch superfamily enzyme
MNVLESYGLTGSLSLALDVIRTRTFFRGARIIRFPIFVRGRKWIVFGQAFSAGRGLRIDAYGNSDTKGHLIHIGKCVRINDYVHIGAICSITIGDRVEIASKVFISDHNHGSFSGSGPHTDPTLPPHDRPLRAEPVVIEDDVWLGESVAVLAGVRIGRGSIVGALATVTRDIPAYSIAVGSPARVVKRYSQESSRWEPV